MMNKSIRGLCTGVLIAGLAFATPASAGDNNPAPPAQQSASPAPVVQDYAPSPALWLLRDDDTHIYLFGTFHVLPAGLEWRTAPLNRVIASADVLVVETSDEEMDGQIDTVVEAMIGDITKREPISSRLSPASAAKWKKLIGFMDMPVEMVDRMPPIFSFMMLGMAQMDDLGSSGELGVETILEAEFRQSGRPILSIEDSGTVTQNLLTLDEAPFISLLDDELTRWDGVSIDSFWGMSDTGNNNAAPGAKKGTAADPPTPDPFADEHKWARGEDVQIPDEDFMVAEHGPAFRDVMLTNRNRAWAVWLDKRLEQPGVVFVAVGAGHLWGRGSVQDMLAERGLTVERINTAETLAAQ
ncbi:MAG: TraB/GumN family protein [Sphingomonadaceae bacterium]|nr:TraB/GumN family protein [Sphingomonadaceae bacterium]